MLDPSARGHERANALKQHELSMRNQGISKLDFFVNIKDSFDSIDLTNNDITEVDFATFARFKRLKNLQLARNRISFVSNSSGEPNQSITSLSLAGNFIKELQSLEFLALLPKLTFLSLVGNPVTADPQYRATIIKMLPAIRYIDFQRVTAQERALDAVNPEHNIKREQLLAQLESATSLEEIDRIEAELSQL